jgi:hypothetical protein
VFPGWYLIRAAQILVAPYGRCATLSGNSLTLGHAPEIGHGVWLYLHEAWFGTGMALLERVDETVLHELLHNELAQRGQDPRHCGEPWAQRGQDRAAAFRPRWRRPGHHRHTRRLPALRRARPLAARADGWGAAAGARSGPALSSTQDVAAAVMTKPAASPARLR